MAAPMKDLGPCAVIWDPDGTPVELNPTFGAVMFRSEDSIAEIFEDQKGVTPVDAVYTGKATELEVPMTRSSLAQLEKVIPGAVKGTANLKVSNVVGCSLLDMAKPIVLKPYGCAGVSTDEAEWLFIHKAAPVTVVEIGYDVSSQRVFRATFKCFPSEATGTLGEIWRIGAHSG